MVLCIRGFDSRRCIHLVSIDGSAPVMGFVTWLCKRMEIEKLIKGSTESQRSFPRLRWLSGVATHGRTATVLLRRHGRPGG